MPEDAMNPARTKLIDEVMAQMEAIEADFGDEFEIDNVITILRIQQPDGSAGIRVRNVTMSPLEAVGLLSVAQDLLKTMATSAPPDGDGE
jgi:hypothetical protein